MLTLICISSHKQDNYPKGYSTKLYTGRPSPEVQPLPVLFTILHNVNLLLTSACFTPFTYLVTDFADALSLKYELTTTPERFFDFFTATKCICWPFWAFLQTEMTDFPTRSYTATGEIPALSYSFLQSLSVYASGGSRGWGGGAGLPFTFRWNWGPKGRKNFGGDRAPPLSQGLDKRPPPPPFPLIYLKVWIRYCRPL